LSLFKPLRLQEAATRQPALESCLIAQAPTHAFLQAQRIGGRVESEFVTEP